MNTQKQSSMQSLDNMNFEQDWESYTSEQNQISVKSRKSMKQGTPVYPKDQKEAKRGKKDNNLRRGSQRVPGTKR